VGSNPTLSAKRKPGQPAAGDMIDPTILPPRLRQFHDLWEKKRGDGVIPARPDFAFEELRPWLGELHLLEVLPDDFRFKVYATGTAERVKREFTGFLMSQVTPVELAREAAAEYRRVVESRVPVFTDRSQIMAEGRIFSWQRLIVPLGLDRKTPDHIFVCLNYLL
jgi:hypothetical protein